MRNKSTLFYLPICERKKKPRLFAAIFSWRGNFQTCFQRLENADMISALAEEKCKVH